MGEPPFFWVFLVINFLFFTQIIRVKATWCVARSDASEQSLQSALDYACYSGADCAPISANGLCYLPNTIQAHASYAFNGFYQRMNRAPGSCDFAGTATIAKTDPSYGSCDYPAHTSTAGGSTSPNTSGGGTTGGTTTPTTTPILYPPPPGSANPFNGNGVGPDIPDSETSKASPKFSNLVPAYFMLLFIHIFQLL
ncbi:PLASMODESMATA CALLOSE-BINDING PROTEIN 3 [Lycium ferocissimum]|uniref:PLASMODESMATA CALLOSE-BINDING PROTEIN 3 n=1 Tax=Lycium ferocissimum TaxID=112874 RepID=UPI0028159357|nr:PLASMODESMATA CALLOSE-BINDING PROTEIN 3 [Lycium ferocissimum]